MTTTTAMPAAPVQPARASLSQDSLKKPAAGPDGLFEAICRDVAQQEEPAEEPQTDTPATQDLAILPVFVPMAMPLFVKEPEKAAAQTAPMPSVPAALPADVMAVDLSAALPSTEAQQAQAAEAGADVFAAVQKAMDGILAEQPAVTFAAAAAPVSTATVAETPMDVVLADTTAEQVTPPAAVNDKATGQATAGTLSATVTTPVSGKTDTGNESKTKDGHSESAPGNRNKTIVPSENGRFYDATAVTPPAGTPVEEARVQGPLLVRQIVDSIEVVSAGETRELTIQLKPDVFGELKIKLELDDGLLRAQIVTDSHPTRVLLQNHLSKLQEALAEKGIAVQNIQIEYSASNTDGRQSEHSGYDQDRRPASRGIPPGQTRAAEPEAAPARGWQSRRPTRAGGIDMLA